MQTSDSTYCPHSASELTESIHSLLFGSLSARNLCSAYTKLKPKLLKFINEDVSDPVAYLKARSVLPGLNDLSAFSISTDTVVEWEHSFYRYEGIVSKPFHPLCEYYERLVKMECRLLIIVAEQWRTDESISPKKLREELLTLAELLKVFIRASEDRRGRSEVSETNFTEQIREYLSGLLLAELGATLMELSIRFSGMYGKEAITEHSLYIRILNQPVPDLMPFYPTRHGVLYSLRSVSFNKKALKSLKKIKLAMPQLPVTAGKLRAEEYQACHHLIENTTCVYYLLKAENATDSAFIKLKEEPVFAEKYLYQIRNDISAGTRSDQLAAFYPYLPKVQAVLNTGIQTDKPSEGVLLLKDLEQLGVKLKGSETQQSASIHSNGSHPLLHDLVSLDDLRERLQISLVTLNKYLQESGIAVIRFSSKSRWLRSEDCNRFLDFYTVKQSEG